MLSPRIGRLCQYSWFHYRFFTWCLTTALVKSHFWRLLQWYCLRCSHNWGTWISKVLGYSWLLVEVSWASLDNNWLVCRLHTFTQIWTLYDTGTDLSISVLPGIPYIWIRTLCPTSKLSNLVLGITTLICLRFVVLSLFDNTGFHQFQLSQIHHFENSLPSVTPVARVLATITAWVKKSWVERLNVSLFVWMFEYINLSASPLVTGW